MKKYKNGDDATIAFNLLNDFCKTLGIDIKDINICGDWNSDTDKTAYLSPLESIDLNGEISPEKFIKLENFLTALKDNGYIELFFLSTSMYILDIDFNGGY